jgi:hypothetical protein
MKSPAVATSASLDSPATPGLEGVLGKGGNNGPAKDRAPNPTINPTVMSATAKPLKRCIVFVLLSTFGGFAAVTLLLRSVGGFDNLKR